VTLKSRIIFTLLLLVGANIVSWLLAWGVGQRYPLLLSTGLLAYGFGLRHAVDADHISAIDNTTRKLMQDGQRPLGVGFFFSLGHSTVVFALCAALALATGYVQRHMPAWKSVGSLAGTLTSGLFLLLIGLINLIVLIDLVRQFRRITTGRAAGEPEEAESEAQGGLMARLLRPLLRVVRHSGQMYIVGFLFGLGFDTATEVGILALSARSGQSGMPIAAVLVLPLLFAVGMCLVDTLDGILMLGVYGWAFVKPVRKLYYNLCITLLSVLVAFVVGAYELLQILQERLALRGPFWDFLQRTNFDYLGFVIVGVFLLGWGVSALIYRWRGYETAGTGA
jgi:high-affinity nickel-transport protein